MSDILTEEYPISFQVGVDVGVPGGIPSGSWEVIDMTEPPYNVVPNSGVNCQAEFNAAKAAAAGANKVIYFPNGVYDLDGLYGNASDMAVRGETMFGAILRCTGGFTMGIGSSYGPDYLPYNSRAHVVDGLTRGSRELLVELTGDNTNPFYSGRQMWMSLPNDWNLPVTSYNGNTDFHRSFWNHVLTATPAGTGPHGRAQFTLTLAVPIAQDYIWTDSSLSAFVEQGQIGTVKRLGIENFTIDMSPTGATALNIGESYSFWVKNIYAKGCGRPDGTGRLNIAINDSVASTIHGLFIEPWLGAMDSPEFLGTKPVGCRLGANSGLLFEKCISSRKYANLLVEGTCVSCALVENLLVDGLVNFTMSHEPHPHCNLIERNIFTNVTTDNYHGSESHNIYTRNWCTCTSNLDGFAAGVPSTGSPTYGFAFKRWSRRAMVAGNIIGVPVVNPPGSGLSLGYPNMGNSFFAGHSSMLGVGGYTPWKDRNPVTGKPHVWTAKVIGRENVSGGTNNRAILEITAGDLTYLAQRIDNYQSYDSHGNECWFHGHWTGMTRAPYMRVGLDLVGTTMKALGYFGEDNWVPPDNTVINVTCSEYGFQELDEDVEFTLKERNNYTGGGALFGNPLLAGETQADSYARTEAPPFAPPGAPWPPFETGGVMSFNNIRAGYNYLNFLADGEFDPGEPDTGGEPPPPTVATPVFSPVAGAYTMPMNVAMTCATAAAEIHYTTDGTTPTAASPLYTAPITLTIATTVKAIGIKSGLANSLVRTGSYAKIAAAVGTPVRSARAPKYAILA